MQLKQLFKQDDAVSPVIGVILMVAITVILAAVIATFVLGLGEQVSETAPQASFSFDFDEGIEDGEEDSWGYVNSTGGAVDIGSVNGSLEIQHSGGPNVDSSLLGATGSNLTINSGDSPDYDDFSESTDTSYNESKMSAGESATIFVEYDDTITVVWTSQDGESSATLQRFEVPEE